MCECRECLTTRINWFDHFELCVIVNWKMQSKMEAWATGGTRHPHCLCRSAPAWHCVVQGRFAHRPSEDAQVQGAGGRQPAGQRPPARRHRDVSVLCQKSGRRSSDQHIPGCYQWVLRQLFTKWFSIFAAIKVQCALFCQRIIFNSYTALLSDSEKDEV